MNAVDIFKQTIERVPAYRSFLTEKCGSVPEVRTMDEFNALPFMNKSDYIMKYPVPDLCLDGDTSVSHLWLRSSGTSGKPFFWPRRFEDEKNMPEGLSRLFHDYTSPEVQPTLIVVGLALGPWGTGIQSSFAFRTVAQKCPGLAVVSPGLQNENIIEVLERVSPHYRRTLLLSYPPFAKMVLEEAAQRGLDLPSLNIHLMVGGEGITEAYRERMWTMLGHTEKELNSVWSLYGSTDFANVGFENPLTIAARRILYKNRLCEKILGKTELPMLFQRVPSQTYFEEVNGELVVTRLQGIPLIRYRTGDHIKLIERHELLSRLRDAGHDAEQVVQDSGLPVPDWQTSFVALYGRIDQAVFLYGANITVEQIKTALDTPAMAPFYNGRFLIRAVETEKGDPLLEVAIEDNDALRKMDPDELDEIVAKALDQIHSEFRSIRNMMPTKKHLRIVPSAAGIFELGWKTRHM